MGSRAFSLPEVLLVMAVFGVAAGLTLTNLKPAQSRASSRAAAQKLAGVLERARGLAAAQGEPVGVAFPSSAGTSPLSEAVQLLEGQIRPRQIGTTSLKRECPGSLFFIGRWNHDGPVSEVLGGTARGTPGERFALAGWGSPLPQDPTLVFTPSGAVVSNLPRVDNIFPIVACQGARWSPTALAGQPTFQLDAVSQPWTVRVTTTGQVDLVQGLWQGSGVALQPGQSAAPSAPPGVLASANQNPTNLTIRALPTPVAASLPAGVDALVPVDGYLTLQATCEDPDGEPLSILWNGDGGSFSHNQAIPMQWAALDQRMGLGGPSRRGGGSTLCAELHRERSAGRVGQRAVGGARPGRHHSHRQIDLQ